MRPQYPGAERSRSEVTVLGILLVIFLPFCEHSGSAGSKLGTAGWEHTWCELGFSLEEPPCQTRELARGSQGRLRCLSHHLLLREEVKRDANQQGQGQNSHHSTALALFCTSPSAGWLVSNTKQGQPAGYRGFYRYLAWHPWKYRAQTEWPSSCFE